MFRFLLASAAVLLLAAPATAQDAEVGNEYEITIETEEDNQYTGPYGQAKIGEVVVNVPNAKIKEKYSVKITAVRVNQYSQDTQASCEFQQVGGDKKGECLAAP
jgi:predicted RNA-binding protein with TRAM domain